MLADFYMFKYIFNRAPPCIFLCWGLCLNTVLQSCSFGYQLRYIIFVAWLNYSCSDHKIYLFIYLFIFVLWTTVMYWTFLTWCYSFTLFCFLLWISSLSLIFLIFFSSFLLTHTLLTYTVTMQRLQRCIFLSLQSSECQMLCVGTKPDSSAQNKRRFQTWT